MTADRYDRICALFDALSAASPQRQEAELAPLEDEDPEAARVLRRMLTLYAESGVDENEEPLGPVLVDVAAAIGDASEWDAGDSGAPRSLPAAIGPYTIVSSLGWGSVGDVYLARQCKPVERLVAVKVFRHARGPAESRRYAIEARALSSLAHPGIAQIFGAGVTDDGRPYLVMEHVDGVPIDVACGKLGLDRDARLRLFLQLCDAVHHAHQQGVIHRDLKPSNVLVTVRDGEPQVKVIDFGIARLTGALTPFHQTLTLHGQLLGTLAYMSPEQLLGNRVDTRTDQYALGVILHQLLTDRLPHDLERATLAETVRIVCHEPTTRHLADDRSLRGDLTTIVGKATAREAAARYDSVHGLHADLRRHLAHQPIEAQPPSRRYLVAKFLRRNRALSTVVATIAATLLVALVAVEVARRDAVAARLESERQYAEARRMSGFFLGDVVMRLERLPGSAPIRRDLLAELMRQTGAFLAIRPDDEELLADYAETLTAHAALHGGAVERPEARLEAAGRVLEIRSRLAALAPDDHERWMQLALALTRYGDSLCPQTEIPERLDFYRRAFQIHAELVQMHPDERRYLDNHYWDHQRIAEWLRRLSLADGLDGLSAVAPLGPSGESGHREWFAAALTVAENLGARFPEHYLTDNSLARAHLDLSLIAEQDGDLELARWHASIALRSAQQLNLRHPDSFHFMRKLERVASTVAAFAMATGDADEAAHAFGLIRDTAGRMLFVEPRNEYWRSKVMSAEAHLRKIEGGAR